MKIDICFATVWNTYVQQQQYINESFHVGASSGVPRVGLGGFEPPKTWKNVVEKWCFFPNARF